MRRVFTFAHTGKKNILSLRNQIFISVRKNENVRTARNVYFVTQHHNTQRKKQISPLIKNSAFVCLTVVIGIL